MKHVVVLFIMLFASLSGLAQGTLASVPSPVTQAFTALYPNVKDVAWDYNAPNYEVRFKVKDRGVSLMFDESGTVSEVKNEITPLDLPGTVRKYIDASYGIWTITRAVHRIVNDEPFHEVYLRKGAEEVTVVFDKNAELFLTIYP